MDMNVFAFTTSYNYISNKLMNSVIAIYNDKTYESNLAQWDTGATNTCISKTVVEQLGLTPLGKVENQTASGIETVNQYRIDIKLPNGMLIKDVFVIDSEIGNHGIDFLIGMDIINLGDFSVSNFDGKTTFTFRIPSTATTDYVKLINGTTPVKKSDKIQPNAPCPCGSGKKYKKCCGKK